MPEQNAFIKWFANYNFRKGGFVLVLLAGTLLPLFILSFYNHPCNDDYAIADIVRQHGFFGAQQYLYLNWTGRYFADIIICMGPLEFNAYLGYKLGGLLFLLLLTFAIYWLSGQVFRHADKTTKIGITSLFLFSYIMRMPDLPSGIFWKASAYPYQVANAISLFLLGCIINYFNSVRLKRNFILSALFVIALVGCYEINLVYIDLLILSILLLRILKKRPLFFILSLLVICIIFSLISVLSPGNGIRGLDYPNAHQFWFTIKESVIWNKFLLIHWMPFMLLMGLLLFDFLSNINVQWNEGTENIFFINPWLSFFACLTIPGITLLICYWAQGQFPALRSLDLAYFYFVTGMMYFLFSLIIRIIKKYPGFRFPVYLKMPIYLVFVYLLVCRTNNISVAYKDLISGTAHAYNKERMERQDFLTSFKGDSCMIDSIKDIPKSLNFVELPRDKSSWINTSFWEYYHKKYVGINGR